MKYEEEKSEDFFILYFCQQCHLTFSAMKFLHVVFHFIHLRILEELFWNLWWRKENMRQLPGLQRFFLWLHVLVLVKPCCQLIIVKPFFLKFCLCRLCIKVLSDDKKLWEDEVYKFARKHQLEVNILSFSIFLLGGSKLVWVIHDFIYFLYQAIAPYIPTKAVKLSSAIYEMVLYDFLKKDVKVFIQLR